MRTGPVSARILTLKHKHNLKVLCNVRKCLQNTHLVTIRRKLVRSSVTVVLHTVYLLPGQDQCAECRWDTAEFCFRLTNEKIYRKTWSLSCNMSFVRIFPQCRVLLFPSGSGVSSSIPGREADCREALWLPALEEDLDTRGRRGDQLQEHAWKTRR